VVILYQRRLQKKDDYRDVAKKHKARIVISGSREKGVASRWEEDRRNPWKHLRAGREKKRQLATTCGSLRGAGERKNRRIREMRDLCQIPSGGKGRIMGENSQPPLTKHREGRREGKKGEEGQVMTQCTRAEKKEPGVIPWRSEKKKEKRPYLGHWRAPLGAQGGTDAQKGKGELFCNQEKFEEGRLTATRPTKSERKRENVPF